MFVDGLLINRLAVFSMELHSGDGATCKSLSNNRSAFNLLLIACPKSAGEIASTFSNENSLNFSIEFYRFDDYRNSVGASDVNGGEVVGRLSSDSFFDRVFGFLLGPIFDNFNLKKFG